MKAPDAKAIRFELEHDDGSVWRLTGDAAAAHVANVNRLCRFASTHRMPMTSEPPWEILRAAPPAPSPHTTGEERLREALAKVNEIRNSIIGLQTMNWSEHVYPLVAALDAAGFPGLPYPEARGRFGTMLERTLAAERKLAALASPAPRSSLTPEMLTRWERLAAVMRDARRALAAMRMEATEAVGDDVTAAVEAAFAELLVCPRGDRP